MKNDRILTLTIYMAILSLLYISVYILTDPFPAYNHTHLLIVVELKNLAISIFAASIFYIINVHLPSKAKKRKERHSIGENIYIVYKLSNDSHFQDNDNVIQLIKFHINRTKKNIEHFENIRLFDSIYETKSPLTTLHDYKNIINDRLCQLRLKDNYTHREILEGFDQAARK